MPIDSQAARLLRMLGAATRGEAGPIGIAERRRSFEGLMRLGGEPPTVHSVEDRSITGPGGPLRLRIYSPLGARAEAMPGLVYFHGGGLVAGSLETYDVLCRTLANASGCRLVAVDYRLAPEHPFPAAIEDATQAAAHVLDQAATFGVASERIAIGGDSAGGTLTAIVCQAFRRRSGAMPRCQLLLCPVLDFFEERPSKRDFGQGYLLDSIIMTRDLDDLAPNVALDDPRVSPLRAADLGGLPMALIHTAGFDPLRDEGADYAGKLAAAGVKVRYTCHEAMIHHFYGLTGMLAAAKPILKAIGEELAEALGDVP